MISDRENKRISKFLSLVLRHQPELIGIELDEQGWTDVNTLIEKMNSRGFVLDKDILQQVIETNSKKRFALNETGERIRASQGHSVEIELGYVAQKPPDILYHGTGEKSVEDIQQQGLHKRQRHHVHLSADRQTALQVGSRYGKPVIFEVLSGLMFADGFPFFLAENGVWLTGHVPVNYLRKENTV
jgi:putative RNA 2'-phosphotransferase